MRDPKTIAKELEQYTEHNMSISGQNVMREAAAAIRAQQKSIWELEETVNGLESKINQLQIRNEDLEAEIKRMLKVQSELDDEIDDLTDLLKRLREWDHMQETSDGRYWRHEIDSVIGM